MTLKRITLIAIALSTLTSLANAAVNPEMVKKVQDYLNGVRSYRATISQNNEAGKHQTGHIYMLRDGQREYGKLRIEYDAPKDLIVVDGEKFIFYDSQTKEKRIGNVEETPAAFLLRRHINLNGDLKVVSQTAVDDKTIRLKVVRYGDESGSSLTLQLSTYPFLKLNGWSVVDPQGLTTQVQLEDVNIGIDLNPDLFIYRGR